MSIKKVIDIDIKSDSKKAQSSFKSIKKDLDNIGKSAKENLSDEGFKKITKELKNTEKAAKSTKTRLRELEDEMADIGDVGSPQFQKLAKEAGVLKDKMNNAKAAIKSMSADFPGIQVGTQALQAMGGAAQGAMGAMNLFGDENEDVTKAIQKMMAVTMIMNSVTTVSNALSDETALGLKVRTSLGKIKAANDIKQAAATKGLTIAQKAMTVATWVANGAMKALNFVISMNPIFLLVAVIAAVIAGFKMFGSSAESAGESNDKLNASMEKQNRLMDESRKKSKQIHDDRMRELALAGADEEKLHEARLERLAEEEKERLEDIKSTKKAIDKKQKLYRQARRESENDTAKEIGKEIRDNKAKLEELKRQRKNYNYSVREENKASAATMAADADAVTASEKSKSDAKISAYKSFLAAKLSAERQAEDLRNGLIEDSEEKALAIRKTKYERSIEDLKVTGEKGNEIRLLLEEQYNADLEGIRQKRIDAEKLAADKINDFKKAADEKFADDKEAFEEQMYQAGILDDERELATLDAKYFNLLAMAEQYEMDDTEIKARYAAEKQDIEDKANKKRDEQDKQSRLNDRANAEHKFDMASNALGAIGDLATAFAKDDEAGAKKAFKINKAVGISQAVISTGLAITGALTAGGNPLKLASGAQFVEAGIAAATGAASIASIAKTKFEGAGATAPAGVVMSGGGGSAASFNVVGNTGINQLAEGLGGQQNVSKTFVVASDVTTAQSLERDRMDLVTL